MKTPSSPTLYWIAAFKLFKATLLVIAGLGALRLLHRDVAMTLTGWAQHLHVDPDNRHIHAVFVKAFNASPRQLEEAAAGTFFYSALLLTEGVGLLLRRRWAEYFTVLMTALFIPFEVYELMEKLTQVRVAVLAINIAIVWYLAARLKKSAATEIRPAGLVP